MNQKSIENNKFITGSLLILALVAIAFSLNFTKPIMIPFVLALANQGWRSVDFQLFDSDWQQLFW